MLASQSAARHDAEARVAHLQDILAISQEIAHLGTWTAGISRQPP